ncbi:YicC/YloC family endoribonuclease [Aliiroseovarius sp. F47248L]|uniref:YicC/YloC family endoribonuclease n=1 Tax=Aliiroseovarius sp. F47248L TaxID=2926420 RepID=UPI001FF1ADC9|nr:YicC/YloC family endoribonuclease [Aliiroseovarius sp. F47248L]MCK0138712.1 YicC family protein [Aliiroseovarius sp. F47248L]
MPQSMTGFASTASEDAGYNWVWDLRSVNARGLDIKIRVPDWLNGLEEALRNSLKKAVARGSVSVSLKITRRDEVGAQFINADELARVLTQLTAIAAEAEARGLPVAPVQPTEIAGMRGVMEQRAMADDDLAPLIERLTSDIPELIEQFVASRAQEGAALTQVLSEQIDEVVRLVTAAEAVLDARQDAQIAGLHDALSRVMDNSGGADPDRVAQELAILAVKTDVREEIDRLKAHVDAARTHLTSDQPVGRKLDFLMQEFNREANTLCSKAQFKDLTAIGLDLKHVIDQMREQVQNVE